MRPRSHTNRHEKGQADHVDAWLMSYADMITLLFMLFVVLVSMSVVRGPQIGLAAGEPPHPKVKEHSGLLSFGFPHDELFRSLTAVVASNAEERHIAVEKTRRGLRVDLSTMEFFAPGSAEIPANELPLMKELAHSLQQGVLAGDTISVEGYTADLELSHGAYANNWELSALRAARVATLLVAEGIDPKRLRATGFAANDPLVPNTDAAGNPILENRDRNRRVVIKVEGKEGLTLF